MGAASLVVQAASWTWFWWVAAGILLIVELTSGTFYLLMIAVGFAAAGAAGLAGFSSVVQTTVAAVVAAIAVALTRWVKRRYRQRSALRSPVTTMNGADGRQGTDAMNLDVGARIFVEQWHQRRSRARYRGADWDVALMDGLAETPGWFRISRVDGICLIVEA